MKYLFIMISFLFSVSTLPHGGGTIKSGKWIGCHNSRKTGGFHCHSNSPYNGMSWKSQSEADSVVFEKAKAKKNSNKYSRKLFPHWIDRDGDCQNERQELLISRSKSPVTFKINKKGKKCTVLSGQWDDFYYAEVLTSAKEIDVDHIVPLKAAFDLGAGNWSRERRREFANDPLNLVITNKKYNRSKGAKTPLEWMPMDRQYSCKYFKRWFQVKDKYNLTISQKELDYYKLVKCGD